ILSPLRHVLMLGLPALNADAKALDILAQEIYRSYTSGSEAKEADGPVQYVDLSEWQNELLEREDTQTGRAYWRQKDFSTRKNTRLPFELDSYSGLAFEPEHFSLPLWPDSLKKIEELSAVYQTSCPVLLLACWQLLLGRLCGQPDVVVGKRYDGRKFEELKGALGLFARYLPISAALSEEGSFAELV